MAIGALATVMPWQDENVERVRGRKFGIWLGFVRNRADPLLLGRVQPWVPAITSDADTTDQYLDWALPKSGGGTNLVVPPMGAPVFITFEQGIVSHAVYEWGWILGSDPGSTQVPVAGQGLAKDPTWVATTVYTSGGNGPPITSTLTQDPANANLPVYPFNKVWQSEGGQILEVDDSPTRQRLRYYHPQGTTILVDSDGSLHFRTGGATTTIDPITGKPVVTPPVANKGGAIYFEGGGDVVVALKPGSTFKVVYPGGTSFACGASGFHVTGHQASILSRPVLQSAFEI